MRCAWGSACSTRIPREPNPVKPIIRLSHGLLKAEWASWQFLLFGFSIFVSWNAYAWPPFGHGISRWVSAFVAGSIACWQILFQALSTNHTTCTFGQQKPPLGTCKSLSGLSMSAEVPQGGQLRTYQWCSCLAAVQTSLHSRESRNSHSSLGMQRKALEVTPAVRSRIEHHIEGQVSSAQNLVETHYTGMVLSQKLSRDLRDAGFWLSWNTWEAFSFRMSVAAAFLLCSL